MILERYLPAWLYYAFFVKRKQTCLFCSVFKIQFLHWQSNLQVINSGDFSVNKSSRLCYTIGDLIAIGCVLNQDLVIIGSSEELPILCVMCVRCVCVCVCVCVCEREREGD